MTTMNKDPCYLLHLKGYRTLNLTLISKEQFQARQDISRMDDDSWLDNYHSVFFVDVTPGSGLGLVSWQEAHRPICSWMPTKEILSVQIALERIDEQLREDNTSGHDISLRVLLVCDMAHTEENYVDLICKPLARTWSCEGMYPFFIESFLSESTLATKGQQKVIFI